MTSHHIPVWNIPGGIYPEENKQQSVQSPIDRIDIPELLIYPLSQHIGSAAEPIVKIGDKVLKGQIIAKASTRISAAVHASTSGEIMAIEDRPIPHPSGLAAPCIILRSDGKDAWIPHQGIADYRQHSKAELIQRIQDAGLAGLGGAGFPSAAKFRVDNIKPIETLILNGAECEPYITADDMLMRERASEVIQGALILQHLIEPSVQTIIGIEDNKPEAIAALQTAAQDTNIRIVVFPTKYPSGGKKQIAQILTGKEIPSGRSSSDIGIFIQNVGTAAAIYRAIVHGEPLISRITTITGNALKQAKNYDVLLGTPLSELLHASELREEKLNQLIMGGSLMGFNLYTDEVPIIKTSNCIIAATIEELPPAPPTQACIRCGLCAEACPASLLPQQLFWFAQSKNHAALNKHHLFDCIECGACSYVCPSNIPLVQYYRAAKADIRESTRNQQKAEHAKSRFDMRNLRLEQLALEKETRRKERLNTNDSSSSSNNLPDPVMAALERAKTREMKQASSPASDNTDDPVAAAIARAKARTMTKIENTIAELEQKLQSAITELETFSEDADKNQLLNEMIADLQKKIANEQDKLKNLG